MTLSADSSVSARGCVADFRGSSDFNLGKGADFESSSFPSAGGAVFSAAVPLSCGVSRTSFAAPTPVGSRPEGIALAHDGQ